MPQAPLTLGSRVLGISFIAGVLALSGAGCGSTTGTMTVVNVDGPGVAVVPWLGGPTIAVVCGTTRVVKPISAPGQPWLITVRALASNHLLLQQNGSGDLEVIVRRGGVLIGQPGPSVGPASVGCAGGYPTSAASSPRPSTALSPPDIAPVPRQNSRSRTLHTATARTGA
jgi:hypothetical protein